MSIILQTPDEAARERRIVEESRLAAYATAGVDMAAAYAAATVTTSRRFPCPHEGEIAEACNDGNCGRDWRHVRWCLFEGHDFERCVRGTSGKPEEIQSCSRCPHHPDAPRPGTPPGVI